MVNLLDWINTQLSTRRHALALWASVATILSVALIVSDIFRTKPVQITNAEEFAKAIASATHYLETPPIQPNETLIRQQVSRLSQVVTRQFGTVKHGSAPFVLREGTGTLSRKQDGHEKIFWNIDYSFTAQVFVHRNKRREETAIRRSECRV